MDDPSHVCRDWTVVRVFFSRGTWVAAMNLFPMREDL